MEELEQLKRLVLTDDYEEADKRRVKELEQRLHRLMATERLASHDVMAEYISFLRSQIARCKEVLSEDDKLTEPERAKLFETIKQSREFLGRFVPSEREELEKSIKDLLNVAKNS